MLRLNSKSHLLAANQPKVLQVKALVVTIQDLKLAIPLAMVLKVIRTPNIFKSGDKWMGITQSDQEGLLVLDLYRKIYGKDNPQPAEHLVVVRGPDRMMGIPVAALPSMVSFAADRLQPLPPDYRDRDTLGVASHLAVLQQGTQTETLFLLDPDRLLHA